MVICIICLILITTIRFILIGTAHIAEYLINIILDIIYLPKKNSKIIPAAKRVISQNY